ncbi:hypothetical protein MBLNU230_g8557t1 [Neophaeotheca triangularis]
MSYYYANGYPMSAASRGLYGRGRSKDQRLTRFLTGSFRNYLSNAFGGSGGYGSGIYDYPEPNNGRASSSKVNNRWSSYHVIDGFREGGRNSRPPNGRVVASGLGGHSRRRPRDRSPPREVYPTLGYPPRLSARSERLSSGSGYSDWSAPWASRSRAADAGSWRSSWGWRWA